MRSGYKLGLDFDRLARLTVVEGIAVNLTPIRVGMGRDEYASAAEMPVLRDADGRPYIPGSSIKGALRSLAEALARASGLNVCNIFDAKNNPCVKAVKIFKEKGREQSIGSEALSFEGPCIVCRIFGNQELASHLVVYDALPVKGKTRVFQRTRVGIDRFRGASYQGALFTYEYIPRNYKWSFKLEIYNIDIDGGSQEAQLLKGLLKHLYTHGLPVGGMKSTGHGVLKLDPNITRVKTFVVSNFTLVLEKDSRLSEL